MKLKKTLIISIILSFSNYLVAQNGPELKNKKAFVIGETIEIQSEILNENRTLNIYLPNGYSRDSIKTYPVIYLLDGSLDEDILHIAGLVQFGSFSWINMIPETIVVGIANIDRRRDFTYPTTNKNDKLKFPTTGESEKFIKFIGNELQPFIEKKYKTDTIKTLIGQSLGGLLATEILFKQAELFDNYIIVSPSLWWDEESLLKFNPQTYQSSKSIYIAVGKEGAVMERTAKELYSKLNLTKKDNSELYFEFFEKQNHGDALHLAVYNAFEQMFKVKKE
jgi:predicted alpha/beta superfamily hydrolase